MFDPARRVRPGIVPLAWKRGHEPEDGDFCIAEIAEDDGAFLVEVLGAEDRPQWDDHAVASQFRLRQRFPAAADREAAGFSEPGEREIHGRLDLRERLVFTIDPEDARDHDDALSVRALAHARFEVGIHIADVSHYVAPGSPLDAEAEARGTSCYLPGGAIPMLPEKLSADLCSLRPDRDRLALSVIADLDARGEVHGVRFEETVIRSRHRLHYGEVQEAMDGTRRLPAQLEEALETLRGLARGLRRRRLAAGALDLEVPEVKAWVNERGETVRIERRAHLESHELIEEFMLLANRLVGGEGERRKSGLLYRVHEPPGAGKLAELDTMLRALGLPRIGHPQEPARALQALLAVALDPPRRRLLHRLVLRSLAKARYLERDLGHFGLATREYCHFTSPIRRYPDLHNHRRVREWIRGKRSAAWDPAALETLATRCSATEQNATEAEREAVRVKGLRHLATRLGERASGIITGFVPRGFFVELVDVPVEGFVRVSEYLDDHFVLEPSGVRMAGRRTRKRYTLGDGVEVDVARVDVPARECDLALVVPQRRGGRRHHGRGR
ncbi:MAG TPA: VacB/RNase II family 3'-5' exoribonuclease [Candidatus Eisenbacteria bacterium]|jgi:ribonuclease R